MWRFNMPFPLFCSLDYRLNFVSSVHQVCHSHCAFQCGNLVFLNPLKKGNPKKKKSGQIFKDGKTEFVYGPVVMRAGYQAQILHVTWYVWLVTYSARIFCIYYNSAIFCQIGSLCRCEVLGQINCQSICLESI